MFGIPKIIEYSLPKSIKIIISTLRVVSMVRVKYYQARAVKLGKTTIYQPKIR